MAHCNIALARVPEKGTSILRTADIFKSALNLKVRKNTWRLGSDKVGNACPNFGYNYGCPTYSPRGSGFRVPKTPRPPSWNPAPLCKP